MTALHTRWPRLRGRTPAAIPVHQTVGDYLDAWLSSKASLRASTRMSYQIHIIRYLKPSLRHLRLTQLTVADVERAQSQIRSGRYGVVSVTTLHRIHATLMSALNTAVRRGLVPSNPAALVELPRTERSEMTIWTTQEAQRFLREALDHQWHLIYRLLLICGLRRGEALGIQWQDLDLAAQTLRIRRQLTLVAGQRAVRSPKSAKGTRTVHLDDDTTTLLDGHRAHAPNTSAGMFVFQPPVGRFLVTVPLLAKKRKQSPSFRPFRVGKGVMSQV